jgi:hypothetical protein
MRACVSLKGLTVTKVTSPRRLMISASRFIAASPPGVIDNVGAAAVVTTGTDDDDDNAIAVVAVEEVLEPVAGVPDVASGLLGAGDDICRNMN